MFRPQSISSTEARKYFSQIINKVQFSSKSFVVKSYRKPVVRLVKEEYIAILEQVLGKQTVGQIMQIAGNDGMREHAKAQEIRKIFQRRLSGGPRPQPKPQPQRPKPPQPQQVKAPRPVPPAGKSETPKPKQPPQKQAQKPQNQQPKPKHQPQPQPKPNNPQKDRGPLLLQNGKNY